ncbi:hypothetical protein BaRGS_00020149, partial [Batillaria attramentaria]
MKDCTILDRGIGILDEVAICVANCSSVPFGASVTLMAEVADRIYVAASHQCRSRCMCSQITSAR